MKVYASQISYVKIRRNYPNKVTKNYYSTINYYKTKHELVNSISAVQIAYVLVSEPKQHQKMSHNGTIVLQITLDWLMFQGTLKTGSDCRFKNVMVFLFTNDGECSKLYFKLLSYVFVTTNFNQRTSFEHLYSKKHKTDEQPLQLLS